MDARMPSGEVKLIHVITRLDLLDGRLNGRYNDIPLRNHSSTGMCEIAEELDEQLSSELAKKGPTPARGSEKEGGVQAPLEIGDGRTVTVDCKKLVEKLNFLAAVAEKLPATKYFADRANKISSADQLRNLTYADFYGYHIVDYMITALLNGKTTPGVPFHKLFSFAPFELCDAASSEYVRLIHKGGAKKENVTNIEGALALFDKLGKKYSFDTKPFKPPSSSKSTRP